MSTSVNSRTPKKEGEKKSVDFFRVHNLKAIQPGQPLKTSIPKVLTGRCRPVAPAEVIGIAGRDDGQITPGEVGPVVDGGGHATIWEAHDRGTGACSLESPKVKKGGS